MVDIADVITIPEMQETLTASSSDFTVVRQTSSSLDKKITLQTLRGYFTPPASLVSAGIVQLNNTTNSTSTTEAATPNSVKITYDFANQALLTAQSALNGLSGKANTVHTHNAADIVAGEISPARLPKGNLNQFGIVAHTSSLANPVGDSANGYVPSLPLVANINNSVNAINNLLNTYASNGTYNRWDGGATGLNPALGRASLGAAPIDSPVFTGTPIVSSDFIQVGNYTSTYTRYSRFGTISVNGGAYQDIIVREASQTEVNNGTAVTAYVSPAKMRSGFTFSGGTNGYFGLPTWLGGFMIKWGQVNLGANAFLDITSFGTELYLPFACCGQDDNGDKAAPHAVKLGNTVRLRNTDGGTQLINWFALGRN